MVWEEINYMTRRSRHDIEWALIAKGFDKALFNDILIHSFMGRLFDKKEMFVLTQ